MPVAEAILEEVGLCERELCLRPFLCELFVVAAGTNGSQEARRRRLRYRLGLTRTSDTDVGDVLPGKVVRDKA